MSVEAPRIVDRNGFLTISQEGRTALRAHFGERSPITTVNFDEGSVHMVPGLEFVVFDATFGSNLIARAQERQTKRESVPERGTPFMLPGVKEDIVTAHRQIYKGEIGQRYKETDLTKSVVLSLVNNSQEDIPIGDTVPVRPLDNTRQLEIVQSIPPALLADEYFKWEAEKARRLLESLKGKGRAPKIKDSGTFLQRKLASSVRNAVLGRAKSM